MSSICARVAIASAILIGPPVMTNGVALAQSSEVPLAYWQHTSWTGKAGPPVPGSHDLLRSADGYLWLSAPNCLLRFDGVRFTVLDSANVPAFRAVKQRGEFRPQLVDSDGVMWIRAPGDVYITYKDGHFRQAFTAVGADPLVTDGRGVIWLVNGKLQRLEQGRWSPVELPAAMAGIRIWYAAPDRRGGLWIGSWNDGLWHVSRGGAVERHPAAGRARTLVVTRDGTAWAIGLKEGSPARLEQGSWHRLLRPTDSVPVFSQFAEEDSTGAAWFQTQQHGVIVFRNGIAEAFTSREGLSDDRVRDVEVDPAGVIWVSTDAGLDRLRPAAFAALDPRHLLKDGIGQRAVADRGGGMWVTAGNGQGMFLLEGGLLSGGAHPLRAREYDIGSKTELGSPRGPSRSGGLWFRHSSGTLMRLRADGAREMFRQARGVAGDDLVSVIEKDDGTVWVWYQAGFGRLRNGRHVRGSVAGLEKADLDGMVEDDRGRLWLGWRGVPPVLTVLEGDSVVARIKVPSRFAIEHLEVEHGDTLWVATAENLFRVSGDTAVEVHVPGLRRILTAGASLAFGQGFMWASSSTGIARLPLDQLHRAADGVDVRIVPEFLDELDGLPSDRASQPNWRSSFPGPDGRVWLNTSRGLAVTNPAANSATRETARLLIEELTIDGQPLTERMQIPVNPGRLEIRFTATGLSLPERARLQYRLAGADKDWVNASLPRVAIYNGLPPGTYQFHVRAVNATGEPNANEAMRSLRIPPAWNETWWFVAFLATAIAMAAASATFAWHRRRTRVAGERAQAGFEATLAERTRIARELHDTLLQEFTGVTLLLEAFGEKLNRSRDAAIDDLPRILTLAQRSLSEARQSVWDMRSPVLDGKSLGEGLDELCRSAAPDATTHVRCTVNGIHRALEPQLETTVLHIAREAMRNAVKHAHARTITVELTYGIDSVTLAVSDDGVGMTHDRAQDASQGGHFGIVGMRERTVSAGGSLVVTTAPGAGTRIELVLPG